MTTANRFDGVKSLEDLCKYTNQNRHKGRTRPEVEKARTERIENGVKYTYKPYPYDKDVAFLKSLGD